MGLDNFLVTTLEHYTQSRDVTQNAPVGVQLPCRTDSDDSINTASGPGTIAQSQKKEIL